MENIKESILNEKIDQEIKAERDIEIQNGRDKPFFEIDVLRMINKNDYNSFKKTMAYVFDVDFAIVWHLSNYDMLWRPVLEYGDEYINHIQWINSDNDRDPTSEMLSYLFDECDPIYDDPYDHDQETKNLLNMHYNKIQTKYGSVDNYFDECSLRLWKEKCYLKNNYNQYYDLALKMFIYTSV